METLLVPFARNNDQFLPFEKGVGEIEFSNDFAPRAVKGIRQIRSELRRFRSNFKRFPPAQNVHRIQNGGGALNESLEGRLTSRMTFFPLRAIFLNL